MGNLKKLLHFCQILVATVICGSMACDDFSGFFWLQQKTKVIKILEKDQDLHVFVYSYLLLVQLFQFLE